METGRTCPRGGGGRPDVDGSAPCHGAGLLAWGERLPCRAQAATNRRTTTSSRSCCACQRSYCNCCCSQLSGLPPNAWESRMAISGEIPSRPLSSIDSVFRETLCRLGHRESKGIEALAPDQCAGMGRIMHEHRCCLFSGSPDSRRPPRGRLRSGTRCASWRAPSRPRTLQSELTRVIKVNQGYLRCQTGYSRLPGAGVRSRLRVSSRGRYPNRWPRSGSAASSPSFGLTQAPSHKHTDAVQVRGQYRQGNRVCKPIGAVGAHPVETAMLKVVDGRLDAFPLDLHVAIQDNDSDIPIDRRPNPFHALHDTFRHIDFPESAIRILGGDMAAAVQQGQTENQPKRRA